nr:DUF6541 family protein [Actinomyces vulturis]
MFSMGTVVALLFLPGWLIAYAWRYRGLFAWSVAPVLSAGVLGCATLFVRPWDRAHVIAVLLVLTAVTAFAGFRVFRGSGTFPSQELGNVGFIRGSWIAGAGLIVAILATVIPLWIGTHGADNPAQASDAVYHLSAARFVRVQGNASPLGGLSSMYDGAQVYYPTLWHGLVALMPGSVVLASNALVIVVAGFIFPITMSAMIVSLAHRIALPPVVVAGTIAMTGSTTSVVLIASSVWPFTLSIVFVPAVLALLMSVDQIDGNSHGDARRIVTGRVALVILSTMGVVSAHGSGIFSLLVIGMPVGIAIMWPWLASFRRRVLWGGCAAVVLVASLLAWVMRAPLNSVFSYQRSPGNLLGSAFGILTGHPQLGHYSLWFPGNACVVALGIYGAVLVIRWWRISEDKVLRAWLVSAAIAVFLVLLAGGPQWFGRILAGPWYTQRARIMPLVTIAGFPLVAVALHKISQSQWPSRILGHILRRLSIVRVRTSFSPEGIVCAIVILTAVCAPAWRWGLKEEIMASIHDPHAITYGAMLSDDERVLIERASRDLPSDAVVLGEPSSGAPYLWSIAGIHVVYPSRPPIDGELGWLAHNIDHINDDPRVCDVLKRRGIGFYYSDSALPDGRDGGVREPLWENQLRHIPEHALERIDSQGDAALWRIIACGHESQ